MAFSLTSCPKAYSKAERVYSSFNEYLTKQTSSHLSNLPVSKRNELSRNERILGLCAKWRKPKKNLHSVFTSTEHLELESLGKHFWGSVEEGEETLFKWENKTLC